MTFSTILALIAAHWHKVVAVVALFAALYNKFSKSKGLNALVKRVTQIEKWDAIPSPKSKAPKKLPKKKKAR